MAWSLESEFGWIVKCKAGDKRNAIFFKKMKIDEAGISQVIEAFIPKMSKNINSISFEKNDSPFLGISFDSDEELNIEDNR